MMAASSSSESLMGDGMGDGLRCSSHHPVDLWLAAAAAAQRQRAWHV